MPRALGIGSSFTLPGVELDLFRLILENSTRHSEGTCCKKDTVLISIGRLTASVKLCLTPSIGASSTRVVWK
jgi:hypothetical protein